jgi:acetate kinase
LLHNLFFMEAERSFLLAVNGGSSSVKFGLYEAGGLHPELSGHIQKIGTPHSQFEIKDVSGKILIEYHKPYRDNGMAIAELIGWLKSASGRYPLSAIGHRVVQGGREHNSPEIITPETIQSLEQLVVLAPDHLPAALATIQQFREAFPGVPQAACYDTAFHRKMPWYAQYYPIPHSLREEGLIRYGFHGLSYEYILTELGDKGGERIIIAHLGNGASMAAVHKGIGIETTMGLTPTGGLVMGTRTGDLDPGLLFYLLLRKKMPPQELDELCNKHAGLEALSGGTSDVQELLAREGQDANAAEALTIFCYQAKKFIGSLAAALGGLNTLVFTGGIGEHAPAIRRRICEGLQFLGIDIDQRLNENQVDKGGQMDKESQVRRGDQAVNENPIPKKEHALSNSEQQTISSSASRVRVMVIPTNEELMIARHTNEILQGPDHP